ncbi:MAG: alpha/beta hydrolase-fold protein [Cyclobacteriaceae bacterium]
MKKYLLPIAIGLFLISCSSEKTTTNQNQIVVGSKDSLYSEILGEQREIWVHVPASFSEGKVYPVLYLLDGDGHFYSVMGMIKQLSTTNGNTVVPEMVIVGIPNTDRLRDLTPTHVGDSTSSSGGGDNFTSFIEKELIPYIDDKYPTTSYRTMIGHSLGGLMAIDVLISKPDLFENYVAIDPSLWWDSRKIFLEAKLALSQQDFEGKSLFVGVANTMPAGMDTTKVVSDTANNTNHIRAILEFSKVAAKMPENNLNFDWSYYDNQDHGSVPLITEHDALKFLFSWYEAPSWPVILDPQLAKEDLLDLFVSHYARISERFGYQLLPSEGKMNGIGYTLMRRGMNEKSYLIFNLNVKNYPESANVYDSMGDYYANESDTLNAIKFFEKAIALGASPVTKEKLEQFKRAN